MYNIKILNKISPVGLEVCNQANYSFKANAENPDGILVRSADMLNYASEPNLKAIARAGAGVNNIPIDRCSKEGIVVFNTPGGNANAVKELVLTSLLISSRRIVESIEWTKTLIGKGNEVGALVEKGKADFAGPEIGGKTLGVVGLGAIGVMVANAAQNLGMKVLGYDPYISVEGAWNLNRGISRAHTLKEIYEQSDYITLHVPLTPETKEMLNADTFKQLKPGVRILNFSRSELVNYSALREAIDNVTVSCYVTDFPNDEVLSMANTIAIPHLGASTPESEDNCACMAVKELSEYLEFGIIKNSVNFPNVELSHDFHTRICIIHHNVPSIITQISGVMSTLGINIENMINKSKKDFAVTVLDIECEATQDMINALEQIADIIRVRVIKK